MISCSSSELYQIYYGFYAVGPLTNADFVPSTIVGQTSNCPTSGVKYLPKSGASTATTTATATKTTTTAAPTGTGVVTGTGYWNANYNGAVDGCLISAGTWYTTGTCATFTATASGTFFTVDLRFASHTSVTDHGDNLGSGFTLKTSKGSCGVVSGAISCASGVTASVFTVSTWSCTVSKYYLYTNLPSDCKWTVGLQRSHEVLLQCCAYWLDPSHSVYGFQLLLSHLLVVGCIDVVFLNIHRQVWNSHEIL